MRFYRKKCEAYNVQPFKAFREKVEEVLEEGEHLKQFHTFDPLGAMGVTAIMQALTELKYKHLEDIKLVKSEIKDEGLKQVCDYLVVGKAAKMLNFPHNQITQLGCQHLINPLSPKAQLPLIKLKLDFNEIGSEGLKHLASVLCQNNTLERLSLNYCNIDASGAKYLQEILGFIDSKLWSLKLKGNHLRNDGVYQLFRALESNQALEKLILTNN